MNQFFTWTSLATMAGATGAVAYITQFLKKFKFANKLHTQGVSYILAVIILFLATLFTGKLTVETGVMIFFNAVIVAFASNGTYDAVESTITSAKPKITEKTSK